MTLKDELAAIPSFSARRSRIDIYLDTLSDADRQEWLEALTDTKWTAKQLATVLGARGVQLSESAVVLWRHNRRRAAG
jgi:hypothetical protein